jgi:hypothetical protein
LAWSYLVHANILIAPAHKGLRNLSAVCDPNFAA